MKSAKANKGSPLTPDEIQKLHVDFSVMWDGVDDRVGFKDAYAQWSDSADALKVHGTSNKRKA